MQSTSDELSLQLPFAAELEIVTVNRLAHYKIFHELISGKEMGQSSVSAGCC